MNPDRTRLSRRRAMQWSAALTASAWASACGGGSGGGPGADTRTWAMGFSGLPPRPVFADALRTIDTFAQRAELAAIHEELPWTALLDGSSPDAILDADKVGLVDYYRAKGLRLMFMGDLTDGLARGQEPPQLRARGRSITEPAVQQLYRSYMRAVARKLRPDYLGLAAETNLVRAAGPGPLYAAVRSTAASTAADLRADGFDGVLFASVQVETAWGRLGANGPFVGIDVDRADFPFMQMLGLSSYPYFGHATPEDIPDDYYRRLLQGAPALPVMQVEGGWPSVGVSAQGFVVTSSPELQARYVTRLASLLDGVQAQGWIQLVFADLDLASFAPPLPDNLPLFATLGFVDSDFTPKPALARWDSLFGRRRAGG